MLNLGSGGVTAVLLVWRNLTCSPPGNSRDQRHRGLNPNRLSITPKREVNDRCFYACCTS